MSTTGQPSRECSSGKKYWCLHKSIHGIDIDLREREEVLHDLEAALHGADVEHRGPVHPAHQLIAIVIVILTILLNSGIQNIIWSLTRLKFNKMIRRVQNIISVHHVIKHGGRAVVVKVAS